VNNLYRTPQTRALTRTSLQTTDRKASWRAVWVDAQMEADAIVDLPSAADNRNGGAGACA